MHVTVLVNGRPVSVTIAEGCAAGTLQGGPGHPPDEAEDYLPED